MFRKLNEDVSVAPQISAGDVAAAKAAGFTLIINNRPDGEAPDQPPSADIEAAAGAADIDYSYIPMANGHLTEEIIVAVGDALAAADGPVLLFCRSGTRSTTLWSLASAMTGADPDALIKTAAAAGYDLTTARPALEALAEDAGSA